MIQLIVGAIGVLFLAFLWREYRRQAALRDAEQDYADAKADKKVEAIREKTENLKNEDKRIADAVLTIFKTRNDLDIFKKKALYIYIREMTDCDTPKLTKVVTVLKEDFKVKYQKLYDLGYLTKAQ